ncbi:MAG: T9SS type A sorting domain-containing protein [Bacteroidia bacterium]
MKKLFLAFSIIMAAYQSANAQCTPDGSITEPGIYPDTLTNLPPAFETASYGTSIQIRVLTDTTVSQGNVTVTNITINSVIGMPAGFSYVCNPVNCAFPGGGNGCIYLSGNPSAGSAGTYNVTVNATLNGLLFGFIPVSQAFTKTGYKIVIHAKPTPNFSALPTTICKGDSVQFTDASSDLPNSWNWTFTGGSPATSTLQNPKVKYNAGGLKNVTLTVGNPAGSNTLTKTGYITVNALPNATLTLTGNDTLCKNDTALMTANSGASLGYQWFKNSVVIAGATAKTYKTPATGMYKVIVTNANGCFKNSPVQKITMLNVTATISAGGPTTFCAGGSVTLSSTTGAGQTYQWFKGLNALAGQTNPNYVAHTQGSYKCAVTKNGLCSKTSNVIKVTVNCKISDGNVVVMNDFSLHPNPSNENAYLEFSLDEQKQVTVTIYDLTGRSVSEIAGQYYDAGDYQLTLNTSELNNGIYFVKINSGNEKQTLKLNVQH